ncbi:hypothetical protein F5Y16DRAFT_370986 [Xylariaceae sp. FL0255]|nr:hypothetical protein F5Y16DRAFT_370986 [Xylariaceae sp. FL0255]
MAPGENLADFTPEVKTVAPYLPIKSYFSTADISTEETKTVGLNVGYAPYATFNPEISKKATETTKRTYYRFVAGLATFDNKTWGEPNAVHWKLHENQCQKSGSPSSVRTAVLLRRRPDDYSQFRAKVKTSVRVYLAHDVMESVRKAIGHRDDPIDFDPSPTEDFDYDGAAVLYGVKRQDARNMKCPWDKNNLDKLDLDEFLIKDDDER